VLFIFYIVACIGNAVVSIVSFFLYVGTRLADLTEARHADQPGSYDDAAHALRRAALDQKERRYQRLHVITLSLFVLFGVLILVHLSNRLNGVMQR
jgi:hypothetical protein